MDSLAGREEFSVWVPRAGTWTTRETPWKQNELSSMVNIMQIALAKSWSVSGASHQPAFISSCLTISHTFYLPYLPSTRGVLVFYGFL